MFKYNCLVILYLLCGQNTASFMLAPYKMKRHLACLVRLPGFFFSTPPFPSCSIPRRECMAPRDLLSTLFFSFTPYELILGDQ